jgi:hypothetical protein
MPKIQFYRKNLNFICFSVVLTKKAFEIKNQSKIIFQVFLDMSLSKKNTKNNEIIILTLFRYFELKLIF